MKYECFVTVELAPFQYATSLFLDEPAYKKDRTVLYVEDSSFVVDAPLGHTHLLADGIWPKTIGIGSKVLHGVSKRLSGNSELKLAYKDGQLVLNRTHLSALEVEFTPDRRYEFSRLELEAEYKRAQEVDPARKDELSHRDMLALAEMFAGWSLNGKLPPIQCAGYAGYSEALRKMADEVGPEWAPPTPHSTSMLTFMAKIAQGERPANRQDKTTERR